MAAPGCKCIEAANKALKDQNCALDTVMCMDFSARQGYLSMIIPLRKLDSAKKRVKLPTMFPTYCPICGIKLIITKPPKKTGK